MTSDVGAWFDGGGDGPWTVGEPTAAFEDEVFDDVVLGCSGNGLEVG